MRTALRNFFTPVSVSALIFAACRGGTVPSQVLTKPAPTVAPAPVAHTGGPWPYRPSTAQQGFVVDQRAVVTIRFDTSVHTDTISSHVEVAFRDTPSMRGISGTVGAFVVQGAGHAPATPTGLVVPFAMRAEYSARGVQLEFSAPFDAAPCSSTALAVAQSLRDIWIRPPDTLRVGSAWSDSAAYVACRDGIPLRVTVHRAFNVSGTTMRGGRVLLSVSRTSVTVVEGSGTQFGEAVSLSGGGSGLLVYDLDPVNGEVVSAEGTAALDFALRSPLRTQVVRQAAEIRIGRS
jgi:hypothetical protein